jgi:SAM-dependent methyltransferase
MEPVAYDCVKLIFVRSGSAILFSEFGQKPVNVGDVVVLGAHTLCGSSPEGHITVTTIYADTDYVVDQVYWQHVGMLQDRLDAQDFAATIYTEPAQVLRVARNQLTRLCVYWKPAVMRCFEELVAEAQSADVSGWGFEWLEGRAVEERPAWGYAKLLADRLGRVQSALDIDTGGGEVTAEAPVLPPTMVVTEAWPPNAERARQLLGPHGVRVVETKDDESLPFGDDSFELVTARHPVRPDWAEIRRVLVPGGRYFAQHVGPASAFELIEYFVGPLPEQRKHRAPEREIAAAEECGLFVESLRTARCRMEFYDVGAIVWILRKCVWWVPDFSVPKYEKKLRDLDTQMRGGHPFIAHSTRHLIDAVRPVV